LPSNDVVADVLGVVVSDDDCVVVILELAVDDTLELAVVVRLELAVLDCDVNGVVVPVEVAVVETDDVSVVEKVVIAHPNNEPSACASTAAFKRFAVSLQPDFT